MTKGIAIYFNHYHLNGPECRMDYDVAIENKAFFTSDSLEHAVERLVNLVGNNLCVRNISFYNTFDETPTVFNENDYYREEFYKLLHKLNPVRAFST